MRWQFLLVWLGVVGSGGAATFTNNAHAVYRGGLLYAGTISSLNISNREMTVDGLETKGIMYVGKTNVVSQSTAPNPKTQSTAANNWRMGATSSGLGHIDNDTSGSRTFELSGLTHVDLTDDRPTKAKFNRATIDDLREGDYVEVSFILGIGRRYRAITIRQVTSNPNPPLPRK